MSSLWCLTVSCCSCSNEYFNLSLLHSLSLYLYTHDMRITTTHSGCSTNLHTHHTHAHTHSCVPQLTGSLSSSFPSRSFACLTTYCFLAYKTTTVLITANKATQPANTDELGPFTGLIPILFVGFGMGLSALAGWSEVRTQWMLNYACVGK